MISPLFIAAFTTLKELSDLHKNRLGGNKFTESDASKKWMIFNLGVKGAWQFGSGVLDRSDLNQAIEYIYTFGGSQGDIIKINNQLHAMGTLERALHSRTQLPGRAMAHSAARLSGHGSSNGVFDAFIEKTKNI